MIFEENVVDQEALILKRADFEAIPITVADALFVTDDTIVKAGTPLASDGTEAETTDTTSDVAGILLHDVVKTDPNGALLKKAYLNTTVAETSYGSSYDAATKAALPMIVFE